MCFQICGPLAEGLAKSRPNVAHHLFSHGLLITDGFHIGVEKHFFNISRHMKMTQISVSMGTGPYELVPTLSGATLADHSGRAEQ